MFASFDGGGSRRKYVYAEVLCPPQPSLCKGLVAELSVYTGDGVDLLGVITFSVGSGMFVAQFFVRAEFFAPFIKKLL